MRRLLKDLIRRFLEVFFKDTFQEYCRNKHFNSFRGRVFFSINGETEKMHNSIEMFQNSAPIILFQRRPDQHHSLKFSQNIFHTERKTQGSF